MERIDVEVKSMKSEIETACAKVNDALWRGSGRSKVQITKSQAEQVQHHPRDGLYESKHHALHKRVRELGRLVHPASGSPELLCFILLLVAALICLVIWA